MAKKPLKRSEYVEVVYTGEHWDLLEKLRKKALHVMGTLEKAHLKPIVHGSIARGDISLRSDVDVFIPCQISSFALETSLEKAGIPIIERLVVQATPNYTMKACIEIDENTAISFPLMNMRRVEREFYRFGGEATLKDLTSNVRMLGVDKRLVLIEPTPEGHKESSVVGDEEYVAKLLGIAVETVLNRVHTLIRRDNLGRTGMFIKKELSRDETFEMALRRLADQNPAVRRRLKTCS